MPLLYTCFSALLSKKIHLIDFLFPGSKIVNPFRFLEIFETWGPYIDGELIKEQAVTAFMKGHWQKEKPVLLGKKKEQKGGFTTRTKLHHFLLKSLQVLLM